MIDMLLQELIDLACRLGASEAAVISTTEISIEDDLANMCREPRCENFGLSANCPPHVAGPDGFRQLLENYDQAVVFKLEVPAEILLSDERHDIFGLLHEISAAIEQAAVGKGLRQSKAFVGGSCKQIFCRDHPDCRVLIEGSACRNPDRARPSMSGFGINVSRLMRTAGWTMNRAGSRNGSDSTSTATVSGLVLIG
jgi:predicted metal-binding protein